MGFVSFVSFVPLKTTPSLTTTSTLDSAWMSKSGFPLTTMMSASLPGSIVPRSEPRPSARFAIAHAEHGFTANVPLASLEDDDALLATHADGEPLTPDHGWPLRGLVPRLYLWKSAKWIRGIELRTTDAPGFWEQNGYHMHGDPWREERFGW